MVAGLTETHFSDSRSQMLTVTSNTSWLSIHKKQRGSYSASHKSIISSTKKNMLMNLIRDLLKILSASMGKHYPSKCALLIFPHTKEQAQSHPTWDDKMRLRKEKSPFQVLKPVSWPMSSYSNTIFKKHSYFPNWKWPECHATQLPPPQLRVCRPKDAGETVARTRP